MPFNVCVINENIYFKTVVTKLLYCNQSFKQSGL